MPSNDLFLTIDQGGHASRALISDRHGKILSHKSEEVNASKPNENWVEHDPEEMLLSIKHAAKKTVDEIGGRSKDIVAAGLSTQRSNIVCWDKKTGEALSPIISWQDRRASKWIERFSQHNSIIHQKTGLFLTAHYGVSKLRWCLDNLPAVKKAYKDGRLAWGPMVSFLLFRLLDQHPLLTDPANASRTLLWNLKSLDWDKDLLNLFEIPNNLLPQCVPTRYCFGDFDISGKKIPVKIATGDQSAAIFANGQLKPETAYINIGTGAFLQRPFKDYIDNPSKLLTSIVLQEEDESTYVMEGTVNGAGSALAKVEKDLGINPAEPKRHLPDWLKKAKAPPLFLNGISGLGSPFWIPDFESRFVGEGEVFEKIAGVIESIVFLLQVNLNETLKHFPPPKKILISGGLSALDGLCQKLANISETPVYRPVECEATATGTAYLLTEQPELWSEKEPGKSFNPKPDQELKKRFKQWLELMKGAILKDERGFRLGK